MRTEAPLLLSTFARAGVYSNIHEEPYYETRRYYPLGFFIWAGRAGFVLGIVPIDLGRLLHGTLKVNREKRSSVHTMSRNLQTSPQLDAVRPVTQSSALLEKCKAFDQKSTAPNSLWLPSLTWYPEMVTIRSPIGED